MKKIQHPMQMIKHICTIAFLLFVQFSFAQSISGDTSVCPGSNAVYTALPSGTYTFSLTGGGSIASTTPNTATINWGNTAGTYTLSAVDGSTTISQRITVEGDFSLACNDLVNITMDTLCRVVVTPYMILEGEQYPENSYTVSMYDLNGNSVPNSFNANHVGKYYNASILHNCSGISCWGKIKLEDKWAPKIQCRPENDTVNCGDPTHPFVIGFPVPDEAFVFPTADPFKFEVYNFDACGVLYLTYNDVRVDYGCNGTVFADITRTWRLSDDNGNASTCVDLIVIRRGNTVPVIFPPNYDNIDNPALKCSDKEPPYGPYPSGWNALDNGNPSPYDYINNDGYLIWTGTGAPTGGSLCEHMAVTYTDIKIDICGASFKLIRKWRVLDWCTGEITEHNQLIKVMDNEAPVVFCSGVIVGLTDYYSCTGTVEVPAPTIIEECSGYTYFVEYKPAGPDGRPDETAGYITSNVTFRNGKYYISNLKLDTTWLQYIVKDDCGNETRCRTEIFVTDNLDPVAVCDEHTVVTLDETGHSKLFATSIDNGSFDNCTLDYMKVARMVDHCGLSGTRLGDFVEFCCEDVLRSPIMVQFRVYDKAGNYNDCMVSVTVQDKIAPEIDCPEDIILNCGANIFDFNLVGRATATDACDSIRITYVDDTLSARCGELDLIRTWRAQDIGGRFDICQQRIRIVNRNPFNGDITWPGDRTVNGCTLDEAHPNFAGRPSYNAGPCDNIVVGYEDEIFPTQGFCYKIIRHWKVLDWCQYEVNNPRSGGIWTSSQIILVSNSSAPRFTPGHCDRKIVTTDSDSCKASVTLIGSASDDCTPVASLIWSYTIDFNTDGTIDRTGNSNNASGFYSTGIHRVSWKVTDLCGNMATCNQVVEIKDIKAPTPFCKPGIITVLMPSTGNVDVWASDLDDKSIDNCTPRLNLRFSFSRDTANRSIRYRCADLPDGKSVKDTVDIWITDASGNQSFCTTVIEIQDGVGNICPNRAGATISGLVATKNDETLEGASVDLRDDGNVMMALKTEASGAYLFPDLPLNKEYAVVPKKNDDLLNGLTTADIVIIQKHILGQEVFSSPYHYIAADANNNKAVTATDISELRKLILGKTIELPNAQKSWRFVQKSFVFDEPTNPWFNGGWNESIAISEIKSDMNNLDFVSIKVGDLNYNAKTRNIVSGTSRTNTFATLAFDNQTFNANELISVPFTLHHTEAISGFQFTFHFDPTIVRFEGFKSGIISIEESNFNFNNVSEGIITMSWNNSAQAAIPGAQLFGLQFRTIKASETAALFSLSNQITATEAYNAALELIGVELRNNTNAKHIELFQNTPNPFEKHTDISFNMPEQAVVKLSIHNVSGKSVWVKDIQSVKGINNVRIAKAELSKAGVYYYTLESNAFSSTKRMLLLD